MASHDSHAPTSMQVVRSKRVRILNRLCAVQCALLLLLHRYETGTLAGSNATLLPFTSLMTSASQQSVTADVNGWAIALNATVSL
jgi:hypothetical protein